MYHAPVESSERCWVFLGWLLHNHWHNLYLVNLWFLSFLHYLWSLPSLCCTLQWLAVGKSCFSEVGLVTAHEFEEVGFEFKNKCELINLGQINKALLCKPVSGLWSRFLTKPEFNLGPAPPRPLPRHLGVISGKTTASSEKTTKKEEENQSHIGYIAKCFEQKPTCLFCTDIFPLQINQGICDFILVFSLL